MSNTQCNNLNDYLSSQIVQYLKERDEKIIEYETLLSNIKGKYAIDECCVCKKFIGTRKLNEHCDVYVEGEYRRCYNAIEYDELERCNTIVCSTCDDDYKYPWHEGNSWFGIPPRAISDYDYICIECGGK